MKYPQQKIFCIGLNKTGTTSIGDALKILGYRRLGWQNDISPNLTMCWHEGRLDKILDVVHKYDAFEDIPWCFVYKELEEVYPNAKFILTERSSADVWHKSIVKHIERGDNWVGHYLIYGSYDPVCDAHLYKNKYESHNKEVRDYFKNKESKLLCMNFEHGDGWARLCEFLGLDVFPDVPFPHVNKAPEVLG